MKNNKDYKEATYYFIKLVELGSYSAVKEDCSVQINTIKKKLLMLEDNLGISLTKNIKNKVTPTKAGLDYYNACVKSYKDLDIIISNGKAGPNIRDNTVKILGAPVFIKMTVDKILPSLKDDCKVVLDVCALHEPSINKHNPDMYDVIYVHSKHLNSIDLDQWIVCSRYEGTNLSASLYGKLDLINEMDNKLIDIVDFPLVVTNYDLNNHFISYKDKLTDDVYTFNNIKYVVSNEIQKSYIIKKGLAVGFMPLYFHDILYDSDVTIMNIESVDVECFADPSAVLINKNSCQLKHLLHLYKTVEKEL